MVSRASLYLSAPFVSSVGTGMTSQPLGSSIACLDIVSFIRGYHAYQGTWLPSVGEVLELEKEPLNSVDRYAVAVTKNGTVVGHVPRNFSALFFHFLTRSQNKGVAKVTGTEVNRGAGYGLEIPCFYRFYGSRPYIERLKTAVEEIEKK